MDTNPFRQMPWLRLIEIMLSFKKVLSKSNSKEWDRRRWLEVCDEMGRIDLICSNNKVDTPTRQQVCDRLKGAKVRSGKMRKVNDETGEESPCGLEGVVSATLSGLTDRSGTWVDLPHVEVTLEDGEAVFHRLEDIKLLTEAWWFSHSEHKPPKK